MQFSRLQQWLSRTAHSRLAPPMLSLVAIVDFFFMVLPSDACLAAAILGNSRRLRLFIGFMVLGRIVAVALLFLLAQQVPLEWFHQQAIDWDMENAWTQCQLFFERFGALSLGITALTPFPMQFVTAISAVSGESLVAMMLSMGVGSAIRYSVVAAAILGGRRAYQVYRKNHPSPAKSPSKESAAP